MLRSMSLSSPSHSLSHLLFGPTVSPFYPHVIVDLRSSSLIDLHPPAVVCCSSPSPPSAIVVKFSTCESASSVCFLRRHTDEGTGVGPLLCFLSSGQRPRPPPVFIANDETQNPPPGPGPLPSSASLSLWAFATLPPRTLLVSFCR